MKNLTILILLAVLSSCTSMQTAEQQCRGVGPGGIGWGYVYYGQSGWECHQPVPVATNPTPREIAAEHAYERRQWYRLARWLGMKRGPAKEWAAAMTGNGEWRGSRCSDFEVAPKDCRGGAK